MEPYERHQGQVCLSKGNEGFFRMSEEPGDLIKIVVTDFYGATHFTTSKDVAQEIACWIDEHTGRGQFWDEQIAGLNSSLQALEHVRTAAEFTIQEQAAEIKELKARIAELEVEQDKLNW